MSDTEKPTTGLIDATKHAALLRDVDTVVRAANIPPAMLFQSMTGVCSATEIDYVKGLRRHAAEGIYGLVLQGFKPRTSPLDRFSTMAAACLRNYISARVMTLQDVLEGLSESTMPTPTVLLVPNFYVGVDGGKQSHWEVPELLGLLYARQAAGLQTVVYVQSLSAVGHAYGSGCEQHLSGPHFIKADTTEKIQK